jgi:hypothetical protein
LLQQAGNWLKNNWEYIAAGAMMVAGFALMFTGVGGVAGFALMAASGALMASGFSMASQKATTGQIDWGQVGTDAAIGAVAGLAGGAAAGLATRSLASVASSGSKLSCLGRNLLVTGAGGSAEGSVSSGLTYLTSDQPLTVTGLAQATVTGGVLGGAVGVAAGGLAKITGISRFGCFEQDTPVLMADGSHKPIQDVQPGDLVMAFNPDTGDTEPQPVTDTYIHEDVATIRVTTTAGEIVTTVNHPFYVEDRGYTPAGDLHENDRLKTPDGSDVKVVSIQATGKTQTVYNLTIADVHNYFVRADDVSVLVHNGDPVTCTPANRGRIQAQGGGVEESVSWASDIPPTADEGLGMLEQLKDKLTPRQLNERSGPLAKAAQLIQRARSIGGVDAPVKQSFYSEKGSDVRIDVEVITGKAFTPQQ